MENFVLEAFLFFFFSVEVCKLYQFNIGRERLFTHAEVSRDERIEWIESVNWIWCKKHVFVDHETEKFSLSPNAKLLYFYSSNLKHVHLFRGEIENGEEVIPL